MTTLVEHTETRTRYLLVGSGYAGWVTALARWFGGMHAPKYEKG
jgi:hypothetical protein